MSGSTDRSASTLDRLISRNLKAKHTWVCPTDACGFSSATELAKLISDLAGRANAPAADTGTAMAGVASRVVEPLGGVPISCTDLRAVCRAAHARGEAVICDNTLATSFGCAAVRLGADIAYEDLGHALGDAGAGLVAVSLSADFFAAYPEIGKLLDQTAVEDQTAVDHRLALSLVDGYQRWDAMRKKQNDAALAIAEYLVCHPKVAHVWYPGLLRDQRDSSKADPANTEAPNILLGGFGPVVDFELADGHELVNRPALADGSSLTSANGVTFAENLNMRAMGKKLVRLCCASDDAVTQARTVEQVLSAL